MLLKLLEILSGDEIPKATRGKMRIHCLENVDKALQFLQDQHVHLENIGAHDIVDGTSSLTLGLIWTIILRFQIQDITIDVVESKETRSAIQYMLNKTNPMYNLNNAFITAERGLGIARLLDAEEVNVEFPDEKSIITYVGAFYHFFSKMKAEVVQSRRINKVLQTSIQK